jgi:hypothetical protein
VERLADPDKGLSALPREHRRGKFKGGKIPSSSHDELQIAQATRNGLAAARAF